MLTLDQMVQINCKICEKEFYAKPSWLKKGHGKYCSRVCGYKDRLTGKEVSCDGCGTKTYKAPKALRGSKSGKYFCSKSCQTKWRNKEFTREKHRNWKGGKHSYRELLLRKNKTPKCTLCKERNVRVLAVHHIDEDRDNNTVENLAWLCHNCHHLVHHYPDEHKRFMAAIV